MPTSNKNTIKQLICVGMDKFSNYRPSEFECSWTFQAVAQLACRSSKRSTTGTIAAEFRNLWRAHRARAARRQPIGLNCATGPDDLSEDEARRDATSFGAPLAPIRTPAMGLILHNCRGEPAGTIRVLKAVVLGDCCGPWPGRLAITFRDLQTKVAFRFALQCRLGGCP